MSFALPIKRLKETSHLLAFYHPTPAYPVHILIVPKKEIRSLAGLGEEDAGFMVELFATVQDLVKELGLEGRGYRLIINGGAYQDFPLLHAHLVSGDPL